MATGHLRAGKEFRKRPRAESGGQHEALHVELGLSRVFKEPRHEISIQSEFFGVTDQPRQRVGGRLWAHGYRKINQAIHGDFERRIDVGTGGSVLYDALIGVKFIDQLQVGAILGLIPEVIDPKEAVSAPPFRHSLQPKLALLGFPCG